MIELVIVYCMVGDPKQCLEQRPVFEQPLTPMSCLMGAELTAADYVKEHPTWKLASWRCEKDKPHETPT
ncbi:MAG: hypothetical protein JWM91_4331 [Rhodospirillales bacterium]|nr:hypothetical protein [Rhodospirillales bacterium]